MNILHHGAFLSVVLRTIFYLLRIIIQKIRSLGFLAGKNSQSFH